MNDSVPGEAPALDILLVQEPDALRDALRDCLQAEGLRVGACSLAEALGETPPPRMHLVLLGGDGDALAAVSALRASHWSASPLLVLAEPAARWPLVAAGADEVLAEDTPTRDLVAGIRARAARAGIASAGAAPTAVLRGGALRRGEFLAQLAQAARASADVPWQVLLALRLDQFRTLGDTLGQAAAYELEQAVAERLATRLQPEDARTLWMAFGFGVLARREDRAGIEALATRLCEVVASEPFVVRGASLALTASVGIALSPQGADAADPDRWFASAHAAQAIAHRLGGNRFDGVLSRDHGAMPPERVLIIREWVKEAVAGENVLIEFQPVLPLHEDRAPLYTLQAMLRDYRAPLAGVRRHEYLSLAREAGALPMIDRMSLFAAFEAVDEERAKGRATRVLVPVDLVAINEAQLRWLDAELQRRRSNADGLVVELDADAALQRPDLARIVQRLEEQGVSIALSDASGDLQRIASLQRFPAGMLRLPVRAVDNVGAARFAQLLAPWRDNGRDIIVDGVESVARLRALWELPVGYAQGDALAASGPRLDYEFTAPTA
jgi:EAL domain-containing protein (putative c-di-GMP-specific phosphodiesterase class I)/GGDEF domain-containing protein